LLHQALGLDSEARTVLLEQITDQDIRSQVETLLLNDTQREQFMQQSASDTLQPGTVINRIRIEKLLGQGGMGSVYLGFDEKLERQVAIKSIRPEHLKNPATQQRFEREAQILSKINHPSICQLYDYLETDGGDFLVLEYIQGKPLYQVPLSETQKLSALAELAAALAVAHEHGIVHRDLKPDNIMITDSGQLKVLDFGIAQSLSTPRTHNDPVATSTPRKDSHLTQQGSLVGTIRYMSPEQAKGEVIGTASDLYALGIIAQEVFSHQAAYAVMETEQLLADVQQGKRLESANLPGALQSLIDDLTQLQPQDRPTALVAAQRFRDILLAPKVKRQKRIKWGIAVAITALLAVLLWQWLQMGAQANRNQLINDYENQINDLVKQADQIYVLPIHPVGQEISHILQQGELLYANIYNDAVLSDADKNRLLGLIMLRAEYFAEAIPLLQKGQAENTLLAEAWTKLYIEKASAFSDQHGYEQAMNDPNLQQNFLQPALQHIQLAAAETGTTDPLLQAFVLTQTESLDSGLQAVNQLLTEKQWNKDAVNLKALILSASMQNAQQKGQWEAAKDYALLTAETYQRSTAMARSYPPGYESLCYTYLGLMTDGIQRSGEQVKEFAQSAIQACENALQTLPENRYPKFLLSRIYLMQARWALSYGNDVQTPLAQAKHWHQEAAALDDVFTFTWTQALLAATEASHLTLRGDDALPLLEQAVGWFEQLLPVESPYRPYVVSDMLLVLSQQAHELIRQGRNPEATYARAQQLYDEIMLTPDLLVNEQWGLLNNMAQIYWVELNHQFILNQDIRPLALRLGAFLSPADNQLIDDPHQLINLANTHLLLANYLQRQQLTYTEHMNLAEEYINQAMQINSTHPSILISKAQLMTLQEAAGDRNYQAANDLFAQALAVFPEQPYHLQSWANSLLLQAQNPKDNQSDEALLRAQAVITKALTIDPGNPFFQHTQAAINAWQQSTNH